MDRKWAKKYNMSKGEIRLAIWEYLEQGDLPEPLKKQQKNMATSLLNMIFVVSSNLELAYRRADKTYTLEDETLD